MTHRVAVLGCGPAGMLAAHAATRMGAHVDIYSNKIEPSPMGGAQYLHKHIPGLTRDQAEGDIVVVKVGSAEGYARKIYGDPQHETSWSLFDGYLPAWNLRDAYERLWLMYGDRVHEQTLDHDSAKELSWQYIVTFSSIPAPALCRNAMHTFVNQPVWIMQEPHGKNGKNTIVYNGEDSTLWYRASDIFGVTSVEFPEMSEYIPNNARKIRKPLKTDCTCCDQFHGFIPVGRYGQWRKGVLTHHAFERVVRIMG